MQDDSFLELMPSCFYSAIKARATCHANVVAGSSCSEQRRVHTRGPAGPHDVFKCMEIWRGLVRSTACSELLTGQDGVSMCRLDAHHVLVRSRIYF